MKILISDAFGPTFEEKLQVFGDVTTDQEQLSEAEVVLIRSKTKCTREYIDNAPNLRLIIRGGVGIDNIDTAYAATRDISVNNTPHASSIAVAELAFALMLAIPSRILEGNQAKCILGIVGNGTIQFGTFQIRIVVRIIIKLIGNGDVARFRQERALADRRNGGCGVRSQ